MIFNVLGNPANPTILFFHAMGVNGESSMPIAKYLSNKFCCIMPTSTVYCSNQKYQSKFNEIEQINAFLKKNKIKEIELIVASSLGADLALAFLENHSFYVKHVFF